MDRFPDDYELLDQLLFQQPSLLIAVATAAVSSDAFFNDQEIATDDQQFLDTSQGVNDQLAVLIRNPSLFKIMTNFTCEELEELWELVCPTISLNARITGHPMVVFGRQPKLSSEQRFLHLILYIETR
jgi:hypothetical protein